MFSATRNESEVQTDGRNILRSENFEVRKCEESLDCEKDEDVLNDIRLEWVDRDYSRSYSKIEGRGEYGLKAHNVYSHALRRWL